ncbi:allophanate hydrolase subunit 2 family protein [Psychrobacillus glaciei]|uniref:Allophanate hydrolase subunit 2 family protein n=1 Tax=Psychrobacillus glaciei TaxID=2283160 RepID=A0A5J6SJT3_9BACI|nr:biotin-dependent carboxyltransferase family protein [Psychrobacillus glaciei]QFF98150.1 allophanate hydrolase subunit 2 family protein [Psychrobacillus glaciei]
MKELFRVCKEAVYASLQDEGRIGYRAFGIPTAGPMDAQAFRLGNKIIGNLPDAAAIELFLGGLSLEVLATHTIAIGGADLHAEIDGMKAPLWKTITVTKGQILSFTKPMHGSIAYIFAVGGFDSVTTLGSKSAYPKANIGVTIKKGLVLFVPNLSLPKLQRGLVASEIPTYNQEVEVEVWQSPHLSLVEKESVHTFFNSEYTYKGGDRMGYYINGPKLHFMNKSDILSEATQFGTIQVPSNGQPVVLMADAQTVGGYATLGKVADKDLWKIAQLRNGGKIKFKEI